MTARPYDKKTSRQALAQRAAQFLAGRTTETASPKEHDGLPSHTIRSLREFRQFPEKWMPPTPLVPDLLYPGRTTLFSSREKMGKSTLASQMIAAVSTGGIFLGNDSPRTKVLWYAIDEPAGDLFRRLASFGADEENVFISLEPPKSPDDFERALATHRPGLIVIDSLGDLWEGKVDSNSHDDTRKFLGPYIREAREVNAALLLIYHTNAGGTKYAGAVAIGAMVDAPLTLKPRGERLEENGEEVPDDGRRILEGRTRYGPVRIPLQFDRGRYVRGGDAPPLAERILHALKEMPQSQNHLRDALNARKESVGEAVRAQVGAGHIARSGNHLTITQAGLACLSGTTGNQTGTTGNQLGTGTPAEVVPAPEPRGEGGNHLPTGGVVEVLI